VAVKANDNGTYSIQTKKDAEKALRMMVELQEEVSALNKEHGITELMRDAAELKKAATAFCVAKGITKLDVGDQYALLRQDGYDRRWIGTREEARELGTAEATPLRVILKEIFHGRDDKFKEIWMRVTKRVVDPDALQEVVDEGVLDEDEIAPAFVEKQKAPYLRLYGKEEG
jgi:hypothetical protein